MIEMNVNGFVFYWKCMCYKCLCVVFVEVECGDGFLVLLLFGDLREMGETLAVVIDAMICVFDWCVCGECVGDEGLVGIKFVYDGV